MPPRPSSTRSKPPTYPNSVITVRTRPTSFEAGRTWHSPFPACSALRIVAIASLRGSRSIVHLRSTCGTPCRTRPLGSTGGTRATRTGGRCRACGRSGRTPSSGRTSSSDSLHHLNAEGLPREREGLRLRHAVRSCDVARRDAAVLHAVSRPFEGDTHVHAEHPDFRVVPHPLEVRIVRDSEREVPMCVEHVVREALVAHGERPPEELRRPLSAKGHLRTDRHVLPDRPIPDGPVGERLRGLLPRRELLAGLADADVHDDLPNPDVPHPHRHATACPSGTRISGFSVPTTNT